MTNLNGDIEPIYDYTTDNLIYYATRGHVDPCQFSTAVMDDYGLCIDVTGIKHGHTKDLIDPEFKSYIPGFCQTGLVTYVEL